MLEEQKKMIELQISILKEVMRQEGLMFGFLIDKKDDSKSSLAIIPKKNIKKDLKKCGGITIPLTELNRGLLDESEV